MLKIAAKVKPPQNGLGSWGAGLTEVSEGRAGTFPHPSAAAREAVGPQPIKDSLDLHRFFSVQLIPRISGESDSGVYCKPHISALHLSFLRAFPIWAKGLGSDLGFRV